MLTSIDMMARIEPVLAKRLETLTGEDGACCVTDLRAEAATLRRSTPFKAALARAKALSDENRLAALAVIKRHGESCACEMQAALGLSHATVSHHMTALVDAGLLVVEKRGKWAYYSIAPAFAHLVP